jgi:hypothetical protein
MYLKNIILLIFMDNNNINNKPFNSDTKFGNNTSSLDEFSFQSNLMPSPTINEIINSNQKYIIDNNVIYKKLLSLENEIHVLKSMISSIQYPHPIIYPTQYNLPKSVIKNSIYNSNQLHYNNNIKNNTEV